MVKSTELLITDENRPAIWNAARSLFVLAIAFLLLSGKVWWAGPLAITLMLAMGSWLYVRCLIDDIARRIHHAK